MYILLSLSIDIHAITVYNIYKLKSERDEPKGENTMYKRYWLITINRNGFETKALVYGTETEMQEYMTSECGFVPAYRGATEAEVEAAKSIGMKAYTA